MDKILFNNVLPHVFENNEDITSEVWRKDVAFEKGNTYLVEADSGKGKSTFCSYVIGYRHDYSGQILFDDKDIGRWCSPSTLFLPTSLSAISTAATLKRWAR